MNKAGAKFDPDKTKWFQHHYLQQQEDTVLAKQFDSLLQTKGITSSLDFVTIVGLLKERATFVSDLWEQGSFFFEAPSTYDEKASKKAFKEGTADILQTVVSLLNDTDDFSAATISATIKGWITSNDIGFGKVMMPLRLALVGEMKGPDVFDIIAILGKEEAVSRIERAIQTI